MKIGIVGGTGGMGEGFALRWCANHQIVIGSRDKNKAAEVASNYMKIAQEFYKDKIKGGEGGGGIGEGNISGDNNFDLGKKDLDILILSIPYESINDTCSKLSQDISDSCIIISPIVPMKWTEKGFTYIPFEEGKKTAAELVADNFKSRSRIVSAFHTISEVKLKKLELTLDADTYICGDDTSVVEKIKELVSDIQGLRPIYLGPLSMTYQAEVLTPMLLNGAKKNKLKNPGLKLVV
ncbi:MAG TPA: NADPH-dependent F420 reductase [Candidatus Nitrosocosmicus sp.]|nr:NADPH-dependent F420 reductase [Candidatus Nitrosocosmicus sp.]